MSEIDRDFGKNRYRVAPAPGKNGLYSIFDSSEPLSVNPVSIDEEPIELPYKSVAEFICERLSSRTYDHIYQNGEIKFFDGLEKAPSLIHFLRVLSSRRALKESYGIELPHGWELFPKPSDLLIQFRLQLALALTKNMAKQKLDNDILRDAMDNEKLFSDQLPMQGKTYSYWLRNLEPFEEVEDWICLLFGFHSLFADPIEWLKDQPDALNKFLLGGSFWEGVTNKRSLKKRFDLVVNKQYPEWRKTQLGSRLHQFAEQLPQVICDIVSALGDRFGSNSIALFCVLTLADAEKFADLSIKLKEISGATDKYKFSYLEAVAEFEDFVELLSILKKESGEKFVLNINQYLNLDGSDLTRIVPECLSLEVTADGKHQVFYEADSGREPVTLKTQQNLPLIVDTKNLGKALIDDLSKFRFIDIEETGALHHGPGHSIYGMESLQQSIASQNDPFPSFIYPIAPIPSELDPRPFVAMAFEYLESRDEDTKAQEAFNDLLDKFDQSGSDLRQQIEGADTESVRTQIIKYFLYSFSDLFSGYLDWCEEQEVEFFYDMLGEFRTLAEIEEKPSDLAKFLVGHLGAMQGSESDLSAKFGELETAQKWASFIKKYDLSIISCSWYLRLMYEIPTEFALYCLSENVSEKRFEKHLRRCSIAPFLEIEIDEEFISSATSAYQVCQRYIELRKIAGFSHSASQEIVEKDESITHEYKSSFQTPVPIIEPEINDKGQKIFRLRNDEFPSKKKLMEHIQFQSFKAIAGFLNTRGGSLVIGVAERERENTIMGIENEWEYEDDDKFERHVTQKLINTFGKTIVGDYLTTKITKFDAGKILVIDVMPLKRAAGAEPVFLNDKLYKRTGPRTDEVKGQEIVKFTIEFQRPEPENVTDSSKM